MPVIWILGVQTTTTWTSELSRRVRALRGFHVLWSLHVAALLFTLTFSPATQVFRVFLCLIVGNVKGGGKGGEGDEWCRACPPKIEAWGSVHG